MSFFGQFIVDAIAGSPQGACCRYQGQSPTGEAQWSCYETTRFICWDDANENPAPNDIFHYPGLRCSDIEGDCGKEACCLEGGHCENREPYRFTDPTTTGCLEGTWAGRGTACAGLPCEAPEPPEEERPTGCMTQTAAEQKEERLGIPMRPHGDYYWNTDLCQNAQFRMVIRRLSEPPRDHEARKWYNVNYGEFVSVGMIRANEAAAGTEPCDRHYAKLVQTKSGYARMMMCGQHVNGDDDSLQVSEGRFYIESDATRPKPAPPDLIDDGYAAVAVGYRAPYWVEAIFHARNIFCTGVER